MTVYAIRRLLGIVPVLILVAIASFLLVHLVPGDPAMVMLGNEASPQQIQALRTQMGLDRSLPEQFAIWVQQVLHGNLGESFFLGRPVAQALMERLPATPRPPITPSATRSLARMTPWPRLNETNATATKPVMMTALASCSASPQQEKSSSGFEDILCLLLLLFNLPLKKIVENGAEYDNCSQLADLVPGGDHHRSQDVGCQCQFQGQSQPSAERDSNLRHRGVEASSAANAESGRSYQRC